MNYDIEGYAKGMAVKFFKWNAEKIGAYLIYLEDIKQIVKSNEIEENLVKFENSTIEERYDLFIQSLIIEKELT